VVTIDDGPHNVGWTHPDEVNSALLSFLESAGRPGAMAAAAGM
jgi:pimeloyl-ACP methyl ester carboxylesterase